MSLKVAAANVAVLVLALVAVRASGSWGLGVLLSLVWASARHREGRP